MTDQSSNDLRVYYSWKQQVGEPISKMITTQRAPEMQLSKWQSSSRFPSCEKATHVVPAISILNPPVSGGLRGQASSALQQNAYGHSPTLKAFLLGYGTRPVAGQASKITSGPDGIRKKRESHRPRRAMEFRLRSEGNPVLSSYSIPPLKALLGAPDRNSVACSASKLPLVSSRSRILVEHKAKGYTLVNRV